MAKNGNGMSIKIPLQFAFSLLPDVLLPSALHGGAPLLPSPGQQSPKAAFDVGTSEHPPALLPNYRKRLHGCRDHETMRKGPPGCGVVTYFGTQKGGELEEHTHSCTSRPGTSGAAGETLQGRRCRGDAAGGGGVAHLAFPPELCSHGCLPLG